MDKPDSKYLSPTAILDSEHEDVIEYASGVLGDVGDDPIQKAVKLYYAVRDGIWYDPYVPFHDPEWYKASNVLKLGRGYCVYKAGLLCALGRSVGIPSRVGFANIRNHLATRQLIEYLGSDLFVYHGFTEFFLDEKWVQATPAFNKELCERHHVVPLDFNGHEDSIFQAYNLEKKQFMEYVTYHGSFADIPLDRIVIAWEEIYGKDRVGKWIKDFEKFGADARRNFYKEEVITK